MVQWTALLVASMGLVAAAAVSEPMAANLVPNPGFEEADGGAPAFWEKRTPDDGSRQLAWSDVARSGKRSLAIANTAAPSAGGARATCKTPSSAPARAVS